MNRETLNRQQGSDGQNKKEFVKENINKSNFFLSCISAMSFPVVGVFIGGMMGMPFIISKFFSSAGMDKVKYPGMPNQYFTDQNKIAGAFSNVSESFFGLFWQKYMNSLSGITRVLPYDPLIAPNQPSTIIKKCDMVDCLLEQLTKQEITVNI